VDIYQLDSKGARRKIEQKPPDKSHYVHIERHTNLWKIAPTTLDAGTGVEFNERLNTGLLQFWASTASVYIQRDHMVHMGYKASAYYLPSSAYSEVLEIPVRFHMGSTEHL